MKMRNLLLLSLLMQSPFFFGQDANFLNFDGQNDRIVIADPGTLVSGSYTKEAWIYGYAFDNADDFFSGSSGSQNAFWVTGGHLVAGHNGSWVQVYDTEVMQTGTWYHVAVTYNAETSTMKLYKNADLVATNTNVPPSSNSPSGWLYVGCYNGGNAPFYGSIDEVRLWSRVLSQGEIEKTKDCELPPGQVGLKLYYKFNQGISDADNTGIVTAIDSSGNGNNGTLMYFALSGTASNWRSGSIIWPGTNCQLLGNDDQDALSFMVFPNPTENEINVMHNGLNSDVSLTLFDLNGRLLFAQDTNEESTVISLKNYPSGIYFLKMVADDRLMVRKVIKK